MTKTVGILVAAGLIQLASSARAADAMPGHMIDTWYRFGEPGPFARMSIDFNWSKGPADEHIYEGFQFFFMAAKQAKGRNRAQGYMGPQIHGKQKRVLFSIWNAADGEKTASIVSGHCSEFGGEGDGIHCDAPFDWTFDRDYRLTVERSTVNAQGEVWVGSIEDIAARKKTEIGEIKVANVFELKGYGGLDAHAAVFTEYVADRPRTCEDLPPVRVTWKGPYPDAGSATTTRTIYPEECAGSNVASGGRPVLIHEAGAGVVRRNATNADVWKKTTPRKP